MQVVRSAGDPVVSQKHTSKRRQDVIEAGDAVAPSSLDEAFGGEGEAIVTAWLGSAGCAGYDIGAVVAEVPCEDKAVVLLLGEPITRSGDKLSSLAPVALDYFAYDFARVRRTSHVVPGMVVGVTARLCSVDV